MRLTDKGQVTIPKHIRVAAGVGPGSEVTFGLEGSKIVIRPSAPASRKTVGPGSRPRRRAYAAA